MQAIITKYLPATNTLGSRFVAKCERGSRTFAHDYMLNVEGNHREAARALCAHFANLDAMEFVAIPAGRPNPWLRPMVCGSLPSGEYAHVFLPAGGQS